MGSQITVKCTFIYIVLATLIACGASDPKATAPAAASVSDAPVLNESLNDIKMVDDQSPYKDVLVGCASIMQAVDSCTLKKLPLIGQDIKNPTVDDVMSRVAVSHPWMADRFREVLIVLPPDILTLLKAVTAIVIDADVRPSYYSSRTGAMYIDPAILWLTNEEKATINTKKDFRQNYGDDLQFVHVWRYVKDNAKAYKNYPLDGTETRELSDILYRVAAVLYHEASHANDFFPELTRSEVPKSVSVYQASLDTALSISKTLKSKFPLKNESLYDMAQIILLGLTPGEDQKYVDADTIGSEFEGDGANDIYNYVGSETSLMTADLREDQAMLFEEVMMKYHFNIDRDIGFLQNASGGKYCNDFPLQWGVRNRIADSHVIERAKLVASLTLPGTDFSTLFQHLSMAQSFPKGVGWCSLLTKGSTSGAAKSTKQSSADNEEMLDRSQRPGL